MPSGQSIGTLSGHQTAVRSLSFIDEGRTLVSLGYEESIRFWDTATWQETRTVRSSASGVRGMALSPDETQLALSLESRVQIWSLAGWELAAELPVSTKVVSAMTFSPDGRWFVAGGADKKVRVWQI